MKDYSTICLHCSYPLDGIGSTQCPECGQAFDPADPSTFKRVLSDPVRIARRPITEANTAMMTLEREGIPATVHEESGGVIGHIDLPQGSIWVNKSDESRAEDILKDIKDEPSSGERWTCPSCGEVLEPQFEVCWNCGAAREETGEP